MAPKKLVGKQNVLFYCGSLLAGLLVFAYGVFIEPAQLIINRQEVRPSNWPSSLNHLKVAVLSDFHIGSLHNTVGRLHKIVEIVNEQKPDLIFLLGDFVASHGRSASVKPESFVHELAGLEARFGVYCVLGNHDWWYNGEDVRHNLKAAQIQVLENDAANIQIGDTSLWVAGLADEWTRVADIRAALSKVPGRSPCVMLMHNPDMFPEIPETVSLSLAGHTHGGQVALPIIGPLIVPSRFNGRYARGSIIEGNKHYFVSSGIGTSVFPIRIGVPPEICVLDLISQ